MIIIIEDGIKTEGKNTTTNIAVGVERKKSDTKNEDRIDRQTDRERDNSSHTFRYQYLRKNTLLVLHFGIHGGHRVFYLLENGIIMNS